MKTSKKKIAHKEAFRKLALVKLVEAGYCPIFDCNVGAVFVYLGDIAQMPGHGVFVGHADAVVGGRFVNGEFKGKIFTGYHNESFVELTDEEA